MKSVLALAAALACAVSAVSAETASNAFTNRLMIIDTAPEGASANRLTVRQSEAGGHRADITILGSENGLFMSQGTPLMADLVPGRFEQQGLGHVAALRIEGDSNGFAGLQSGSGHVLTGEVLGSQNFAQVMQTGSGQIASFRQVGTRNSLSISQSSW